MGLNDTASAERLHIGFFGIRNAGKSSLVNAVTGQNLSVVSEIRGTTTDPVKKAMELLPLGPVVIIDTPGLDDEGGLGALRVEKARQILDQIDIAVLVTDASRAAHPLEQELLRRFAEKKVPFLIARNKADLLTDRKAPGENALYTSAVTKEGIRELKERLGAFARRKQNPRFLLRDLLRPGDLAVLVIPIDESAPKGRLILPQQMALRDILDAHASAAVCQDTELSAMLSGLARKPRMVITDSQAFARVSRDTPEDIPLTSFSILMARYKGDLAALVQGASALRELKDGDPVLIAEGCTHHRQCNDIGTVKMPGWIRAFCKAEPAFSFTSGNEFPADLSAYRLVVHCGGCMLNEAAMKSRMARAAEAGVPIVNYGIAIAHMNGILRRSLQLFPDVLSMLGE